MTYGLIKDGKLISYANQEKWLLNGNEVVGERIPDKPSPKHVWGTDDWVMPEPTEQEVLLQARATAAATWRTLPVQLRARYGTLYTAINDALNRDDVEAALYLLQTAEIDPTHEGLHDQFKAAFGL